ncbi:MAG: GntR family transcriptional regulator [Abditibacteriota bacterium]|nr:GntR family transcriptional regulator [Abditibacteriota bacterium]
MTKTEIVIAFIKEGIQTGKFKPGDKIKSEKYLSEKTGVSRLPVREALRQLISEGIIYKQPNYGCFIANNNNPKYIIISTPQNIYTDNLNFIFNKLCNYLVPLIEDSGYKAYINIENSNKDITEQIDIKSEEIVAYIPILYYQDIYKKPISEGKPIISVENIDNRYNYFPSIMLNTKKIFFNVLDLTEKYNLKNNLFFAYREPEITPEIFINFNNAISIYLKNNFQLTEVVLKDIKNLEDNFCNTMDNLTSVPDAIVFMDDTIFKLSYPLFKKYDHIMKNTKMITHSNGDLVFNDKYKVCEIVFDLEEIAKLTVEHTLNYINKKNISVANIYYSPKVVNEGILK